jgi:hypothetical protein
MVLSATVALSSCGDSAPVAPPAAPAPADSSAMSADLLGTLTNTVRNLGLLTCRPMPAYTASKTIGPRGGTLQVGPHTLTVPRGALRHDVRITGVAPSGTVNRVTFSPHGLEFERRVAITMNYDNCSGLGSLLPKRIAYTDGLLNILYFLLSLDNIWTNDVTGFTDHFSDYVIAW